MKLEAFVAGADNVPGIFAMISDTASKIRLAQCLGSREAAWGRTGSMRYNRLFSNRLGPIAPRHTVVRGEQWIIGRTFYSNPLISNLRWSGKCEPWKPGTICGAMTCVGKTGRFAITT